MLLLALAIAPGLAISLYIFFKDQYNREPRRHLVISFFLGILSAGMALLIETFLVGLSVDILPESIGRTAVHAFLFVAFTEEWCKYIMVRGYAFPKPEFDEPFDGIVYSVMVSMGFATIENIGYVMQHGYTTAILRMFLSVPAHASFAIIMGYYMGKAKFAGPKRATLMMKGLVLAVFWHGTYDFFLFLQDDKLVREFISGGLLFLGALISFILAIRLAKNALDEHIRLSKQMHGEDQQDQV
jgi:RsiW-degrading membrane proteinase PrsW (M82 family)